MAVHRRVLTWHGGADGVRDEGLLESVLARPHQLFTYENPTVFAMAASYLYGICKNHPFVDGNKRTAFMAAYVFLRDNGQHLKADEVDTVLIVRAVAAGEVGEKELANWLENNSKKS